jgi:DNA-binding MurR/RpiR family transcriptional regulator
MDITPKCLLQIRSILPELSGKYGELANFILANPDKIIRGRVKDIAADCACDESLVVRLCQKLGYKGFPDLKASLASEFLPVGIDESTHAEGSFEKLKEDFLKKNVLALKDTSSMLSEKDIVKAVKLLASAKRIFVLGVGSSGIVAMDAQMKLFRLGFSVVHQSDPNLLLMLAGLAAKDDCLLAISYTGETESICCAAKHFKETGAKVVALSKFPNSTLSKLADATLLTASDESVFRLGAMTSRLAQMFVIDFLILSLAMRDMDSCQENILKTHSMLKSS